MHRIMAAAAINAQPIQSALYALVILLVTHSIPPWPQRQNCGQGEAP
jgi:hypothetical protein